MKRSKAKAATNNDTEIMHDRPTEMSKRVFASTRGWRSKDAQQLQTLLEQMATLDTKIISLLSSAMQREKDPAEIERLKTAKETFISHSLKSTHRLITEFSSEGSITKYSKLD